MHCKTRRAIFIRCDADIEYKIDGKLYKEQVQFSYLDIVSAPRSATIVRSASNPALVTLDVAVDKIWNQVAGFAILMSAFAIFAFFCVFKMVQFFWRRKKLFSLSGQKLLLVPVEIEEIKKSGPFRAFIKFKPPGQVAGGSRTMMGRNGLPFYVTTSPSCSTALAVTDDQGEAVLLLDEKLTRLNFSKAERAALYEAREFREEAAA